jgi:hypothetical protein
VASVVVAVAVGPSPDAVGSAAPAARDPLRWPFARTSIWNTPIGTRARYLPAQISSTGFGVAVDWLVVTRSSDRAVPVYMPAASGASPCTRTAQQLARRHGQARRLERVPEELVISSATSSGSTFLQPDGRTLVSFDNTARCVPGGPLYGQWRGQTSVLGDGISRSRAGPGLSGIGGSIRMGELTGSDPIRHALKFEVAAGFLFRDHATGSTRWPARRTDVHAAEQFAGSVPGLRVGSLLALAPTATAARLGVRSAPGTKLLAALRDYGAYVAGVSGAETVDLFVEHQAAADFAERTGYTVDAEPGLRADMDRIIPALAVVDDNSPSSVGGRGARRAPWAPPLKALPRVRDTTAARGSTPSSPSAINAARTADVESPDNAPAAILWAVTAAALGLLVLGLWSGRRVLRPAPGDRRVRQRAR